MFVKTMKLGLMLAAASLLGACDKQSETVSGVVDASPENAVASVDLYQDYLNRPVTDDIFYFVLPDRFENGDPSNDQGSLTIPESQGGFDPTNKGYYHGGDLAGLTAKLDYLKDMGVTAVWLTPILRNQAVQGDSSGYHGYWILDFTQIDPHLGSNAELNKLIDTAHSKGMKVFFDIIVNHTADVISYRECHNEDGSFRDPNSVLCPFKTYDQVTSGDTYSPFIANGRENLKTPAWLNDPQYYNNRGDSVWVGESVITGDFVGLDDLNTTHPRVVQGMIDIYKDIITEFKPDGFRIDTVKHVEMSFWEQFDPEIMAHAKAVGIPQFHIFGEVAQGDAAFLSRYSTLGKMPATLDFQHFYTSIDVFAKGGSPQKLVQLSHDDDYYRDHDSDASLKFTFVSNHDNGRFGYFLNTEQPQSSEEEKLKRSLLSHAYMYFSMGVPVIFYGDEQGFTGDGNDKDARENMMPSLVDSYNDNNLLGTEATTADDNFDPSHPIYRALGEFAETYKAHPALRRGAQYIRFASQDAGLFAFARVMPDTREEYLVVFNTAKQNQWQRLLATADRYEPVYGAEKAMIAEDGEVTIALEGLSFAIYRATSQAPVVEDLSIRLASATNDRRSPSFVAIDYSTAAEEDHALPLLTVTTEVSVGEGQYELVGIDDNAPFTAKLLRSKLVDEKATLRVTVNNHAGQTLVQTFDIDVR
ncbi:MAG TPA: alpha-amylase family glycosyl hydrolase [Pseudomonadales bacterium]|nr:alpha-amylase family glycosyl hydrolase [Pseudomonadales bacterium]